MLCFALFAGGLFYMTHTRSPKVLIPVGLIFAVIAFAVSSNGSITLNARQGTATVHIVSFGYPKTYRYPLASIRSAYVGSSDQSDAMRLMLNAGSELQLTPYNDISGKSEAALATNQFLRAHGGTGYLD